MSIFFPLVSIQRKALYKKIINGLNEKGVFLLEACTPEQLNFGTGGGNDVNFIQSKVSFMYELKGVNFNHLVEF